MWIKWKRRKRNRNEWNVRYEGGLHNSDDVFHMMTKETEHLWLVLSLHAVNFWHQKLLIFLFVATYFILLISGRIKILFHEHEFTGVSWMCWHPCASCLVWYKTCVCGGLSETRCLLVLPSEFETLVLFERLTPFYFMLDYEFQWTLIFKRKSPICCFHSCTKGSISLLFFMQSFYCFLMQIAFHSGWGRTRRFFRGGMESVLGFREVKPG